jgi:lipopolysaccharide export system permease protein
MKIFFRYLFLRLLQPFVYCLSALTILWVVADVYGTMEDFIDHKVTFVVFMHYYALQIPHMLVQVLPAAVLFSTLSTLLSLNRRSELVALQAGGMAPLWLLSPFLVFGLINALVLAYDMSGPAARAEVTRNHIMKGIKGESSGANDITNLPYVDGVNHRVWYFQDLNASGEGGKAKGLIIWEQDAQGHDVALYAAQEARWTGRFWRLSGGVKKITYNVSGNVESQENFEEFDLADVTTPPRQLSLVLSPPEDLTVSELSEYIATSTQTQDRLASYRTEWWYRMLYPFTVLILMLFALVQCGRSDRRSPAAGIGIAIAVLVAYSVFSSVFMAAGKNNRLPPFVAVSVTEVLFAAIALHWLAVNNGWYWQAQEWYTAWRRDGRKAPEIPVS